MYLQKSKKVMHRSSFKRSNFRLNDLLYFYFIDGTPKSLHIFLASISLISVCLGIDERLLNSVLIHQECLDPSLNNLHRWDRRYFKNFFRFIR